MLKYPAIIDDNTVLPQAPNGTTIITSDILGDILNKLRDAIIRIEKELGVKPSRIHTNVRTRLDEIDKTIRIIAGGDLLRVVGTPVKGQTIIWNGSNWVPDTNFLAQNLTTTSNFKVGRSISTSVSSGLAEISGKLILNKITQPSVSDPGDGIIYFDKDTGLFMVSENGAAYVPLNIGSGSAVIPNFSASLDLSGDRLSQTVVGLRGNLVNLVRQPLDGEPLSFNDTNSYWITGTDFGSNVISTTANFKTKTIKITDFGANPGVLHSDSIGLISAKNIVDADVDSLAAIKGTKIRPEFGTQDILTQKSISSQDAVVQRLYIGSTSSVGLISTATPWPFSTDPIPNANDGTIHVGSDGYISIKRGSSWFLLPAEPLGQASGDLSGQYPNNISVVGIKGANVSSFNPTDLKDGYVLRASTASSLLLSPVPIGSTNSVTGVLPKDNQQKQSLIGDLSSTTDSAVVKGIQGVGVSSTQPTEGQFLAYNSTNSRFEPTNQSVLTSNLPVSGGAQGDLDGTYPNPTVKKIQGLSVKQGTSADGYIFQVIGEDPSSTDYLGFASIDLSGDNFTGQIPATKQSPQPMLGPDVTGSTDSATIVRLNGMAVSTASPSNDYCLVYDKTTNPNSPQWVPKSIAGGGNPNVPVNGNGAGDLGGSYPNPNVVKINGASVPTVPSSAVDGHFLYIEDINAKKLNYGPLDLSDPNSIITGILPSSNQESQALVGDVTGTTSNATVEKIQGVYVDNNFTGKDGYYVKYDNASTKFTLYQPKTEELNGYASISITAPTASADTGKIYFDGSKLKAIEGTSSVQDISPSSFFRPLAVLPLSLPSTLSSLAGHTATALPGGKILIVGGTTNGVSAVDTVYLYDPIIGDLQLQTTLKYGPRRNHTATLTKRNGKDVVVIIGGTNGSLCLGYTEFYDVETGGMDEDTNYPYTNFQTNGGMQNHTATLLRDNTILICGGENVPGGTGQAVIAAYLYEPGFGLKQIQSELNYGQYWPNRYNIMQSSIDNFRGNLNIARKNHTATLIIGGRFDGYVLIAGGRAGGTGTADVVIQTSELYDPNTKFFYGYAQPTKYDGCASVMLDDGSILYTGGWDSVTSKYVSDCYIYNPNTNLFRKACPLIEPRAWHTITKYYSDNFSENYIIIGGKGSSTINTNNVINGVLKTSEIYSTYNDLRTTQSATVFWYSDYWSSPQGVSPSYMKMPRYKHTTTMFTKSSTFGGANDIYFLVCGGFKPTSSTTQAIENLAEVYYAGDFYKLDKPMLYPRADHTSNLLPDGKKIMICGGQTNLTIINNYDLTGNYTRYPATGPTTLPDTSGSGYYPTQTTQLLNQPSPISAVEYFDVENFDLNISTQVVTDYLFGSYNIPVDLDTDPIDNLAFSFFVKPYRFSHVKLQDGNILICGGWCKSRDNTFPIPSQRSFVFNPNTKLFYKVGDMVFPAVGHTLTKLPDDTILSIGGIDSSLEASTRTYGSYKTQVFDPVSKSWSVGPSTKDNTNFAFHTATPIMGYNNDPGRFVIIIAGGLRPGSNNSYAVPSTKVQMYDFNSNSFVSLNGLSNGRFFHTASLTDDQNNALPSKILFVGGGYDQSLDNVILYSYLYIVSSLPSAATSSLNKTAEIYDIYGSGTNGSSSTITSPNYRICHTATRLSNGNIIIAGGGASGGNQSVDMYDVTSGSFVAKPQMFKPRTMHSAALLQNGKILFSSSSTSELYDPDSTSSPTSALSDSSIANHNLTYVQGNNAIILSPPTDNANLAPSLFYNTTSNSLSRFGSWLKRRRSGHTLIDIGNNNFMVLGGFSNLINMAGLRQAGTLIYEYTTFSSLNPNKEIYNPLDGTFTLANTLNTDATSRGFVDFGAAKVNLLGSQISDGYAFLAGGQEQKVTTTTYALTVSRTTTGGTTVTRFDWYKYVSNYSPNNYQYIYHGNVPTQIYYSRLVQPDPTMSKTKTDVYTDSSSNVFVMGGYTPPASSTYPYIITSTNQATDYVSKINKYNLVTQSWSTPGFMQSKRVFHTSSPIADGYVLIAGGSTSPSVTLSSYLLASTEIFNPNTLSFDVGPAMSVARSNHTAASWPQQNDGSIPVLITGGQNGAGTSTSSSQIHGGKYNSTWSAAGNLINPRYNHTASLMLDSAGNPANDVIIIGGNSNSTTILFKPETYSKQYNQYTQISQKIVVSGSYTASYTDSNIIFIDPSPDSKIFKCTLTLPTSSSCQDGQLITASISPNLASSFYTFILKTQASDTLNASANQTLNLQKSSISFILDKSNNPPTWWQVDSGS